MKRADIPLVSIITPSYNSKSFFKETFDSVISQTFNNWEWIIVDDCSIDDSLDFIKKMCSSDERIKVFSTNQNSGAAVTRNVGISKASGRYICFLDSDDLWKEDKLEKQLEYIQNNEVVFCYTDYDVRFLNGKTKKFSPKSESINYKKLLKKCDIGCLTVMYDSLKLGKVYMNTNAPKREDYATWLELARKGTKMFHLKLNLAIYRINNNGVSFNKFKLLKYHWHVYRKCEHLNLLKSLFYLLCFSFHKIFVKY